MAPCSRSDRDRGAARPRIERCHCRCGTGTSKRSSICSACGRWRSPRLWLCLLSPAAVGAPSVRASVDGCCRRCNCRGSRLLARGNDAGLTRLSNCKAAGLGGPDDLARMQDAVRRSGQSCLWKIKGKTRACRALAAPGQCVGPISARIDWGGYFVWQNHKHGSQNLRRPHDGLDRLSRSTSIIHLLAQDVILR